MENNRRTSPIGTVVHITLRWACIAVYLTCNAAISASDNASGNQYEQDILSTIQNIKNLEHAEALEQTRSLLKQHPNSRLGQMLYADLLMAKTGKLTSLGSGLQTDIAKSDFQLELQRRLEHQKNHDAQSRLPANLLVIAEDQPYIIVTDQQKSRIYVFRNNGGVPALEADYFITIGLKGIGKEKRGDQKTPVGVYHVTRYIDDKELPDLYGWGAFPISYPNAWDRRLNRTGDGIWIHGTPSYTYNRSPWASNGCIVVSNPDFGHIDQYVSPTLHTPVIVTDTIEWISREEWQQRRNALKETFEEWLSDWQSLDHENYSAHYSQTDLQANGRNFKAWDGHKKWVNRNKTRVSVKFENLSIFEYPGEEDLILMQYQQFYDSNNFTLDSPKELYWKKENDNWKIVYEGTRPLPKPQTAAELVQN